MTGGGGGNRSECKLSPNIFKKGQMDKMYTQRGDAGEGDTAGLTRQEVSYKL